MNFTMDCNCVGAQGRCECKSPHVPGLDERIETGLPPPYEQALIRTLDEQMREPTRTSVGGEVWEIQEVEEIKWDLGDPQYLKVLDELRSLHVEKSSSYGTDVDRFANFTRVAEATGQPRPLYALLRIIEKATRAVNQIEAGRLEEVEEFPDIAGLAICAEAMRRADGFVEK